MGKIYEQLKDYIHNRKLIRKKRNYAKYYQNDVKLYTQAQNEAAERLNFLIGHFYDQENNETEYNYIMEYLLITDKNYNMDGASGLPSRKWTHEKCELLISKSYRATLASTLEWISRKLRLIHSNVQKVN